MCEDVKAKISVIKVNLLLLISKFTYMKFDIFYNIYDNIHICTYFVYRRLYNNYVYFLPFH